jgi:hypothetical protein
LRNVYGQNVTKGARLMTSVETGLAYERKDLEVMSSMRDFSPLVFGIPAAMMLEDPRLEIDSAARLMAFWTHIGCSEEWQRQQLGDWHDQAREALATYRALKAGEAQFWSIERSRTRS